MKIFVTALGSQEGSSTHKRPLKIVDFQRSFFTHSGFYRSLVRIPDDVMFVI